MNGKELFDHLKNGNEVAIKTYLDQGGDPNIKDDRGNHILAKAILFGHRKIAMMLISAGADTFAKYGNRTALYYACIKSYYDVFEALDPENKNVNEATPNSKLTPLIGACANPSRDNEDPLDVEDESYRIAKRLLELGADVSMRDSDGDTALHGAAKHKTDRCTKLLLDAGADIDVAAPNRSTPLGNAAFSGSEANVSVLLERGADPNGGIDENGYTPLAWAANFGHEGCVDILLRYGAKLVNQRGFTTKGFLQYLREKGDKQGIVAKLEPSKGGGKSSNSPKVDNNISKGIVFVICGYIIGSFVGNFFGNASYLLGIVVALAFFVRYDWV